MRGALFICLLMFLPQFVSAKMTWEEMKDPSTYDNFAFQILQWTHVLEAQPNYVALSDEALESLKFWRIQLAAEKELHNQEPVRLSRGLASMDGVPALDAGNEAYQAWQGQQAYGQMPVGGQAASQPAAMYCRPNESCLSEDQFYGEPVDLQVHPVANVPRAVDVRIEPIAVVLQQQGMSPNEYSAYLERLRQTSFGHQNTVDDSNEYDPTFGLAMDVPLVSAGPTKVILDPSEGDYHQRGEYIYQCYPGRGCNEIVGHISEFQIGDAQNNNDQAGRMQKNGPGANDQSPARPNPNSPGTPAPSKSSAMSQAFQRCDASYKRALDLCGSSFQSYDSQAVQSELNLRSGMMLARYLQMARAASQSQGKSMYEICDNTQKMAQSMTALNAAYTAICASAQNSCASACSQADSYMRDTSTSDQDLTAALNSTSAGFDPARFYNTCKADMNQQVTQGIFETAQTAQMMAQANSCKQQIAAAGPCATPEMWDSQACYDFCQDPKNSYQPACARFTAMNSNCSNAEFASKNPMCLCINHPDDPSCSGGLLPPSEDIGGGGPIAGPGGPGRGGIPSSTGAGSFGSRQAFQGGAQRAGQASSASQGSFPASGAGGPIMNQGSGGGSGAGAPGRQAALRGSSYKTGIIDGVQNFGGSRGGAQGQQKRYIAYGDMDSKNPYRRIAVPTDNPDFDLKQYLPPEDFEAGKVRKCYYGKDRIGCMHGPSLFDMVSRQYRKLRHTMMP